MERLVFIQPGALQGVPITSTFGLICRICFTRGTM
jgi:hypothetical protein